MLVAKQVLVWLTLALLALTLVYGVVHGIAWMRRRRGAPQPGAHPADRPRDPQLAPREERVFGHQPAAGGRELDLPVADGRARAREVRTHQRAAAVASPRRADVRLRDLGARPRAAAVRAARRSASCRRTLAYWLGHPLVAPILITASWVPIEALLIARVGTTPGKWLFGVYPAILDFRCLCAARHARAVRARAAPRVPRVVGGHRLRLPVARAGADRASPTRSSRRTRRPTGTSRRTAS